MMWALEQLGHASVYGGGALLVVWGIVRAVPRLSASVRSSLWRLGFAKLLIVLAVASTVAMPLLPERTYDEVAVTKQQLQLAEEAAEANPAPGPVAASTPWWALGLALLWTAGAAACVRQTVRAWQRARQLCATACPTTEGPAYEAILDISKSMGLSSSPGLALIDEGSGPMLVGLFKPTILLPAPLAGRPEPELRMMLAHELAHFARRDLMWNMVVTLARTIFFFHPVVHLAAREASLDQETAADELALATTGAPVKSYGALLVDLLRPEGDALVALHAGSSPTAMKRRLAHLAHVRPSARRARAGLALAAIGLLVLAPVHLIRPDPPVTRMPVTMELDAANFEVVALTIGVNSGFTVLCDHSIANREITVNFKDVPALDALRQAAAGAGLRVAEVPYVTGPRPAYLVLPPEHADPVKMYRTESADTVSMAIKDASALVILDNIAIRAGRNSVIDPAVGKKLITLNLRDVPASQAMNLIADQAGVALEEREASNGKLTWVITPRR